MYTNISTSDRVFRLIVSYLLIFTVVGGSGPIGAMAYLPLIAIYTGITAFIGWDPISALVSKRSKRVFAKTYYATTNRMVTQ